MPIDEQKGSQEWDGHRPGDNTDHGGAVQGLCDEKRLHHDNANSHKPAVDQVVLPDRLLLQLRVLDELFDLLFRSFGFTLCLLFPRFGFTLGFLIHRHHLQ